MTYKTGTWGEQARQRNAARRDYFKERSRLRRLLFPAKVAEERRRYYEQHGGTTYKLTPQLQAYKRAYRLRFPEKVRARKAVYRAIHNGKLVKLPCEICGEINVHAHHEDYSKPLEVIWLCPTHHGITYRKFS